MKKKVFKYNDRVVIMSGWYTNLAGKHGRVYSVEVNSYKDDVYIELDDPVLEHGCGIQVPRKFVAHEV